MKKVKVKVLEKDIVRGCLELLALKKIMAWRNNTGGFKNEKGGFYRFGDKGSPDIFAILKVNGISAIIGVEVKSKTGKQSESQKQWQENFESNNGFYFIIKDTEDLIDKLDYAESKTMSYLQKGR